MSVNNVLAIESAFEVLRSEEGDEVSHLVHALLVVQLLMLLVTATASLEQPVPAVSSTGLAMAGRCTDTPIFGFPASR